MVFLNEKKHIPYDIRSTPIFATSVTRVVHTCCFRNTTEEELFTAYEQQPREVQFSTITHQEVIFLGEVTIPVDHLYLEGSVLIKDHTCGQEGHFFFHTYSRDIPNDIV